MKTKICILLSLMTFTAWAADIIITVPAKDGPRVQEAFGRYLNLGRPATLQEVTDYLRSELISITYGYEGKKNLPSPTPLDMQPTPTPTSTATPTSTP